MFQVARSPALEEVKWKTLPAFPWVPFNMQWGRNGGRVAVHGKGRGIICPCISANKEVPYLTVFDSEIKKKKKNWLMKGKGKEIIEREGGKKGGSVAVKSKEEDWGLLM